MSAAQLVPTGFLPKAIDTPQKAVAVLLKGRELGIPAMQALANIAIINGKPTVQAELMMALVKRAYGRDVIWVEESTDQYAKVGYLVHHKPRFYSYTMEMAKTANLANGPTYKQHPAAMLRARTISAVCRMEFPEVIGGMYAPGELGEDVRVDEATGEVVSVDYTPRTPTVTVEPPNPEESNEKAMKRLHAVAAEHGITHDDLHLQAVELGRESLADFDAATLNKTADAIQDRPKSAFDYYVGLRTKAAEKAELAAIGEQVGAEYDAKQGGK